MDLDLTLDFGLVMIKVIYTLIYTLNVVIYNLNVAHTEAQATLDCHIRTLGWNKNFRSTPLHASPFPHFTSLVCSNCKSKNVAGNASVRCLLKPPGEHQQHPWPQRNFKGNSQKTPQSLFSLKGTATIKRESKCRSFIPFTGSTS